MDIHESVSRILESEAVFGDAFYGVFLNRFPEVQQYFAKVNMQRQAVLLTMAMLIVEQYHGSSYPAMAKYLNDLGARHREWGIPKETYSLWREALIESLEKFHGDDWNDALAYRWDVAIDRTTKQMLKGYEVS